MTRRFWLLWAIVMAILAACRSKTGPGDHVHLRDDEETDDQDHEPPPQRLVRVHNPSTGKTHLIDLNRMATCDGVTPLPLADGSFPNQERLRRALPQGPKIARPDWLRPPAGASLNREDFTPETPRSTREAVASSYGHYSSVLPPADVVRHYRELGAARHFVVNEEGGFHAHSTVHQGLFLKSLAMRSRDGREEFRLEAQAGEYHLHFSRTTAGRFNFDPVGWFPHLDLHRFDDEQQLLYFIDRATGQRFTMTAEILAAEDETPRDIRVLPARLPAWFRHYPGAKVQSESGPMMINGERHEDSQQQTLTVPDGFDRVLHHYESLLATRGLPVDRTRGDEFRTSARRYENLAIHEAGEMLFVGIRQLRREIEISVHLMSPPSARPPEPLP